MDESSQSKLTHRSAAADRRRDSQNSSTPGLEFLRKPEFGRRHGNPSSQELTLSYLCEKDFSDKGKEIAMVERDFLNLNTTKRPIEEDEEQEEEEQEQEQHDDKRPKLGEALNLSLALPEVSLSLTASNALHHHKQSGPKPARSVQSLTYNSNDDYTAAPSGAGGSMSYSYSHPFSHNPSCSLTSNFDDQIWNCGEGTNGSVHSRFKPVGGGGDSLVGLYSLMQGSGGGNNNNNTKENSLSFFPSELPARPVRIEDHSSNNNNNNNVVVGQSGDSRGKAGSESFRGLEGLDRSRKKGSKPERLLREIVGESVPTMAQAMQELSAEAIVFAKEYLRGLISGKKDELANLQARLERRSDLSKETLAKCQKDQLEILVAVKMGHLSFLASKNRLPSSELVEIFSFARCRNVNCKNLLPVDDCDCKICSGNKGFCNACMCSVCLNFDCANNTCNWVGCDVCSHWCHASCGLEKNLIKPGPGLKGPTMTSEMQFHCICCGHASEMFGFVKAAFLCCAKDWGLETLIKELDCVRKIFRGSDDFKGKELHNKADEIISKLGSKSISPKDAVNFITQFFNYAVSISDLPPAGLPLKESLTMTQSILTKDATPSSQPAPSPVKYIPPYGINSGLKPRDFLPSDLQPSGLKLSPILSSGEDFRFGSFSKPDSFESLESVVRIKEAEARMFQTKADEALRAAEEYHRVIRAATEKLEAEYAEKLNKLHLQETEERRRKKLEELKALENSHCDYYNMKIRMQGEIAGLLERMEATKKQWV